MVSFSVTLLLACRAAVWYFRTSNETRSIRLQVPTMSTSNKQLKSPRKMSGDPPEDLSSLLSFYTSPPMKQNEHYRSTPRRRPPSQTELREKRERRRLSSAFFMHTSPNHAFYVSRLAHRTWTDSDPDSVVNWDHVRLVKCLCSATQESACSNFVPTAQCPICLDDTCVAPRITRCGHVFCYSCILAHFYSSYKTQSSLHAAACTQKCPCCLTHLALEDLRPVQFAVVQYPTIGATMTFLNSFSHSNYSRYTLLQSDILVRHLQSDLIQLQQQPIDDSTSYFSTMALNAIQCEYAVASTDTEPLENLSRRTATTNNSNTPDALFYQAADEQLCFLSDLNMQCLATEFRQIHDNESSYPPEIQGKVLDIQRIHLTPAVRHRLHLKHLPLYMDITVVELNLHHILSRETKQLFKSQFSQHKKERSDRKRRDKVLAEKAQLHDRTRLFHSSSAAGYTDYDTNTITTRASSQLDLASSFRTTLHMDDFGPSLPTMDGTIRSESSRKGSSSAPQPSSEFSYRTVCASGGLFPSLPKLNKS